MVDPNRKINRLINDSDFLEDCEDEFANRFTEHDPEFMAHCSKPVAEPPLVDNWGSGGGGTGGGNSDLYNNRFHNQRQGWQRRGGGGGGYHNNYTSYRDNRPYRSDRGGRDRPSEHHRQRHEGGGRDRPSEHHRQRHESGGRERPYERRHRHEGGSSREGGGGGGGGGGPMRVRRDYGNFVPASKD